MKLRIIFDGPPGPDGGRFVEVEDEAGKSVSAGRWTGPDADGLWALEIETEPAPASSPSAN